MEGVNTVQKIDNRIIDNMIDDQLSSKEIDFMLCISRFQNDYGYIPGIHYKAVCQELGISFQAFYDIKKSLQEKGYIKVEKKNKIDHDITILNNVFVTEEDIKKGYLNTNHHMFYDKEFTSLRAGAKLLGMFLLRQCYFSRLNDSEYRKNTKDFYKEFTKRFHVTKRVLRSYLMDLKKFFSIGLVNKMYYVRPMTKVFRHPGSKSENEREQEHQINVICRRNHVKEASESKKMKDIYTLVRQYKKDAQSMSVNIYSAIQKAIERSILQFKKIKDRVLMPKLIHVYLRDELGLKTVR